MVSLALISMAFGQDYRFPTTPGHAGYFYPTAYFDHGGVTDWACGGITYGGHRGSDFGVGSFPGMDAGRDLVAAASGVVYSTHDGEFDRCTSGTCYGGGGFGNYVQIDHPDGKRTIYAHMKQWSVAVTPGQAVTCGQYLGQVGSSGYSTGPHLHFEVRNGGVAADPFDGPCSFPPSWWLSQGPHGGLPGLDCESATPCAPAQRVGCGAVVDSRNDAAGSTQHGWFYGCSEFTYSGPELTFEVVPEVDGEVTLTLSGLTADLDLYLLESTACDGSGCLATSHNPKVSDERLSFTASAGAPRYLVVDGWEGAVSNFRLEVSCADWPPGSTTTPGGRDTGDPGEPDPADTGADPSPETGAPPDDPEPPGTDGQPSDDPDDPLDPRLLPPAEPTGCGCRQAPGWSPALIAGALLVSRVRRRRRP